MATKMKRRKKGKSESDLTPVVIPQHTPEKEEKPKYELLDSYYNFNTWNIVPVSKETLERLRENGIKWAIVDDNALKISQFLVLNGIRRGTWERWREKWEEIKEAHEVMLMAIGDRREVGLLTRKFDSGATIKSMPIYDEDWGRLDEWKAKLTQKDALTNGQQFIIMEATPTSPLVPERKEEE